jgi:hypothetical protein
MLVGENTEFCDDCPMKGFFIGPVTSESLVIDEDIAASGTLNIRFEDVDGFMTRRVSIQDFEIDDEFLPFGNHMPAERVQKISGATGEAILKRVAVCRAKSGSGKKCPALDELVVKKLAAEAWDNLGKTTPDR